MLFIPYIPYLAWLFIVWCTEQPRESASFILPSKQKNVSNLQNTRQYFGQNCMFWGQAELKKQLMKYIILQRHKLCIAYDMGSWTSTL